MGMESDIHSIQLETTSRCNLNCRTCIKTEFSDVWRERDMDLKLFNQFVSQVKEFKEKPAIHLQGWGEPLVHPDTYSHVRELKKIGATVSFTTNGSLMDRSVAASLVECGLNGLTFSMAGVSPATQDTLRGAGMWDKLKRAIRTFASVRNSFAHPSPDLAVSYLLTPQTASELPKAVSWCAHNGVDTFVTVHLTQAVCRTQRDLQLFMSKKEARHYQLLRIHTHMKALLGRIHINLKNFYPTLTPVCGKNPLNNLFISSNGDVSPCVYLCPPHEQQMDWHYQQAVRRQGALVFGNIRYSSLSDIWNNEDYQSFRDTFQKRLEYHDAMLSHVSYSLAGSEKLESAIKSIRHYFSSNPPPTFCEACAKMDGY